MSFILLPAGGELVFLFLPTGWSWLLVGCGLSRQLPLLLTFTFHTLTLHTSTLSLLLDPTSLTSCKCTALGDVANSLHFNHFG